MSRYLRIRRQPGTASSIGMCSCSYQAVMSASIEDGTELATAKITGAAPSPPGPSSLTWVYIRRSRVARCDMMNLSRSLPPSTTALYSALSSTAGLSSSYSASHRGVRSSSASYRHAPRSPGTVSRAGPCSWSYQSW